MVEVVTVVMVPVTVRVSGFEEGRTVGSSVPVSAVVVMTVVISVVLVTRG